MYFIRKFYLLASQGNSDALPSKYAALHLGQNVLDADFNIVNDLGEMFEETGDIDELTDELDLWNKDNEGLLYRIRINEEGSETESDKVCLCSDQLIPDYQFELINEKYGKDIAIGCAVDLMEEVLAD